VVTTPDAGARWRQFLDTARQQAASPQSTLEAGGTLTRLTGLVLEAVGIRASVGSQCLISQGAQAPVLAEVVGFAGDRAFLMPAGDVQGLSSGASVVPTAPYVATPRLGEPAQAPAASQVQGLLRLPLGDGLLGRVVDAHGEPLDRQGPLIPRAGGRGRWTAAPSTPWTATRARCAGHRRARHQRPADRGPRSAHRPVRRRRRGQESCCWA
jgi:flagellum-specific ATP synthase